MEFSPEIKSELIDDINTLKKMLDQLASEINYIEQGKAIEFISPIMQINRIDGNVKSIRATLQDLQAEGTEYTEFP